MIINFRQGIINASSPFIQLNTGNVDLITDNGVIDLAFAYGDKNYMFTETAPVNGAWGPFQANKDYWLYWDIDINTGIRTFGSTNIEPSFGATLPQNPLSDTHFFDFSDKKMKVWTGNRWVEKLRVFSGMISSGGILNPQTLGSQVNLNGQTLVGYILFDEKNNPIKAIDRYGRGYFVTTTTSIYTQNDIYNSYKIDALVLDGKAMEPIPAFYCVSWKGPKQIGLASSNDIDHPCIGLSLEPSGTNQIKRFTSSGFITNPNWNFTNNPNTPVFVGSTGEVTTIVSQRTSLQKIGHIVSPDTIFLNIQDIIGIE